MVRQTAVSSCDVKLKSYKKKKEPHAQHSLLKKLDATWDKSKLQLFHQIITLPQSGHS